MPSLPQLLEEDISSLEASIVEFLGKSEANAVLIIDKGGFLITQQGEIGDFDTTTIGALAAASYVATEGVAGLVSETNFSCVYQQGENSSLLVMNVDEHCLMVVIFSAHISVGAVKYYSGPTVEKIRKQFQVAAERSPGEGIDLSTLNLADTSEIFKRKPA